jgi:crossover junction endodeoxyribonuclease RuvC
MNMLKRKKERVLGIDVGTAIVGWEIMDSLNNKYVHVAGGVITTSKNDDMSLRLREIFVSMQKIILEYEPKDMAIEDLFFFKNQKTIITVSQARGVLLLAGKLANLNIFSYTPLQVKIAVTGYGRSEKKQVQYMVQRLMNFKTLPKPDDWADAVAISICHLNTV